MCVLNSLLVEQRYAAMFVNNREQQQHNVQQLTSDEWQNV